MVDQDDFTHSGFQVIKKLCKVNLSDSDLISETRSPKQEQKDPRLRPLRILEPSTWLRPEPRTYLLDSFSRQKNQPAT